MSRPPRDQRISPKVPYELNARQQALLIKVEALYREAGFAPPSARDAARLLGVPVAAVQAMTAIAEEQGILVTVATDLTFHRDAVVRAQALIQDSVRTEGPIEPSRFRDLIGSSRKFAIPLLEHLDRIGFTCRIGDRRVLSEARDGAAAEGPQSGP